MPGTIFFVRCHFSSVTVGADVCGGGGGKGGGVNWEGVSFDLAVHRIFKGGGVDWEGVSFDLTVLRIFKGIEWEGVSFDLAVPLTFSVSLLMHCSSDLTVFAV